MEISRKVGGGPFNQTESSTARRVRGFLTNGKDVAGQNLNITSFKINNRGINDKLKS